MSEADGARSVRAAAALAAVGAALVYGTRLAPSIVLEGDSTEIVSAAAVWGVPHAPGYPLLTLLGFIFSMLPFGSVAWRIHLSSALFHAGAVYAVGLLAGRLTRSAVGAAVAGVSLALARAFFVGSLYAEVFPLNDLFFAVLLLLAFDAGEIDDEKVSRRRFFQTAALFGLALAHQPIILFGLPALAYAARRPLRGALRSSALGLLIGSVVLPFVASYTLVLLSARTHPPISSGDVHDLPSLVRLILRVDFGGPFHASRTEVAELDLATRLAHWSASFMRSVSILPLAAAVGLVIRARQGASERATSIALGLAVLVPGPAFALVNAHFQRSDEPHIALAERFTTMALVALAPALGVTAELVLRHIQPKVRRVAAVILVALPVLVLGLGVRGLDYSRDRRGLAYARDLLRPAPDGAVLLVAGDIAGAAALYTCRVEKACGDRVIVAPGLLSMPWYRAQLARQHPSLVVPPSVHQIHDLVESAVDRHVVLAMPSILLKNPELLNDFDISPALLFLRLTRKTAPKDPGDALLWALAMDDDSGRCAGCRLDPKDVLHPSLEAGLATEYATAMKNHAVFARDNDQKDLADRLERRAARLTSD